jgi:hypothetical protein
MEIPYKRYFIWKCCQMAIGVPNSLNLRFNLALIWQQGLCSKDVITFLKEKYTLNAYQMDDHRIQHNYSLPKRFI